MEKVESEECEKRGKQVMLRGWKRGRNEMYNLRLRTFKSATADFQICDCGLSHLRLRTLDPATAHSRGRDCALSASKVRTHFFIYMRAYTKTGTAAARGCGGSAGCRMMGCQKTRATDT